MFLSWPPEASPTDIPEIVRPSKKSFDTVTTLSMSSSARPASSSAALVTSKTISAKIWSFFLLSYFVCATPTIAVFSISISSSGA